MQDFSRVIPHRWRHFRITKQTEEDWACGLHCIAAAAVHLGKLAEGLRVTNRLLKILPSDEEARLKAQVRTKKGLWPMDIRRLSKAARLSVYRPRDQQIDMFTEPNWLWLAAVKLRFDDPLGKQASYESPHYVLVLDYLAGRNSLILADPHPWRPFVYAMSLPTFDKAWQRLGRKPWAVSLYPARD